MSQTYFQTLLKIKLNKKELDKNSVKICVTALRNCEVPNLTKFDEKCQVQIKIHIPTKCHS